MSPVSYDRSHSSSHPPQKVSGLDINLPAEQLRPGIAKVLGSLSRLSPFRVIVSGITWDPSGDYTHPRASPRPRIHDHYKDPVLALWLLSHFT